MEMEATSLETKLVVDMIDGGACIVHQVEQGSGSLTFKRGM